MGSCSPGGSGQTVEGYGWNTWPSFNINFHLVGNELLQSNLTTVPGQGKEVVGQGKLDTVHKSCIVSLLMSDFIRTLLYLLFRTAKMFIDVHWLICI